MHRVAEQLIYGIDRLLGEDPHLAQEFEFEVVTPNRPIRDLGLKNINQRQIGLLSWQLWEQLELPLHTRGRFLVSLCNLAPCLKKDGLVLIHDAQVFLVPESYRPAFRVWYRYIQTILGHRLRCVAAISEYSKEMLYRYRVVPPSKPITVIHNGVDHFGKEQSDTEILTQHALRQNEYVLALSDVRFHKNISILFTILNDIRMSDMRLVLFGAATREDFEAAGHSVPDGVVFAGKVADEDLAVLYRHALCLAFPSLTEGFGLPPLEAMLFGCPAVVSPEGALPEVCGDAAIYAPAKEPGAWANAFARLKNDEAERTRRSELSRERAAQFTWSNASSKLIKTLQEISRRQ